MTPSPRAEISQRSRATASLRAAEPNRAGVRRQRGDQGVAGLVDGEGGEFAGGQRAAAPGAEQHAVAGAGEVGGGEPGTAGPYRGDGGLVDQVGQVGQVRAGESGGGGGDL